MKALLVDLDPACLAAARMGLGTVLLLGWLAVTGRLGRPVSLSADQWSWALLTGLLLSGYVATWYLALARAQAVDVTAVLVFGAVVTAVLSRGADGVAVDLGGLILVTAGAILIGLAGRRRAGPEPA